MLISRNTVIYVIIGAAVVLSVGIYILAPDSSRAGADIAKDNSPEQATSVTDESDSDFKSVDSSITLDAESRELAADDSNARISDAENDELVSIQIDSFEAHMAVPGARAEAYVLEGNALQMNRLLAVKEPEDFDVFAATLERNADPDSYEKAGEYMRLFNSVVTDSSSSVVVSLVSCGGIVCAAKFQSQDTADIEQYLKELGNVKTIPMYATAAMPPEANTGYDIRRLVFTTDPSAAAFVSYPEQ